MQFNFYVWDDKEMSDKLQGIILITSDASFKRESFCNNIYLCMGKSNLTLKVIGNYQFCSILTDNSIQNNQFS